MNENRDELLKRFHIRAVASFKSQSTRGKRCTTP